MELTIRRAGTPSSAPSGPACQRAARAWTSCQTWDGTCSAACSTEIGPRVATPTSRSTPSSRPSRPGGGGSAPRSRRSARRSSGWGRCSGRGRKSTTRRPTRISPACGICCNDSGRSWRPLRGVSTPFWSMPLGCCACLADPIGSIWAWWRPVRWTASRPSASGSRSTRVRPSGRSARNSAREAWRRCRPWRRPSTGWKSSEARASTGSRSDWTSSQAQSRCGRACMRSSPCTPCTEASRPSTRAPWRCRSRRHYRCSRCPAPAAWALAVSAPSPRASSRVSTRSGLETRRRLRGSLRWMARRGASFRTASLGPRRYPECDPRMSPSPCGRCCLGHWSFSSRPSSPLCTGRSSPAVLCRVGCARGATPFAPARRGGRRWSASPRRPVGSRRAC
mmetsp:Transcript_38215/g.109749  ORF Transcript_38215/g.109749 Transcript_38215/m.109749 type:complete len:393 (+) Transcript_38215:132-1310(+)